MGPAAAGTATPRGATTRGAERAERPRYPSSTTTFPPHTATSYTSTWRSGGANGASHTDSAGAGAARAASRAAAAANAYSTYRARGKAVEI